MLDTRFPRPPGDAGNPASWPAPALLKVVEGAWPRRIVQSADGLREAGVLRDFVDAVRELAGEGATAITTSCGFLVLLQQELQDACAVPVVSSSLLQLPALLRDEERVGVLTISAQQLGEEHLLAAGVARERLHDVVVQGVNPAGEFARSILGNRARMDLQRAGDDVLGAALTLRTRAPDLRTVVLECTNMPPYAQAVREATGCEPRTLLDSRALSECFG